MNGRIARCVVVSARVLAACLLAISGLAGCGASNGSVAVAAASVPQPIPAPAPLVLAACLDSTGSVGRRFGLTVRDEIAQAIAGHLPVKPANPKDGVAPLAGLSLELRLVTTRPLGQNDPYVRVDVPSVPGLAARPDISVAANMDAPGPGQKSPYDTWHDQSVTWSQQYDAAVAATRKAVAAIKAVDLNVAWSGITGCMSALALDMAGATSPRFLLASDLQENVSTQLTGSLAHGPVFVVQPCPSGIATTCDQDFSRMAGQLRSLHAGRIIRVTEANSSEAIHQWITP